MILIKIFYEICTFLLLLTGTKPLLDVTIPGVKEPVKRVMINRTNSILRNSSQFTILG
jgi:hypothetical protein